MEVDLPYSLEVYSFDVDDSYLELVVELITFAFAFRLHVLPLNATDAEKDTQKQEIIYQLNSFNFRIDTIPATQKDVHQQMNSNSTHQQMWREKRKKVINKIE